jgi:cytochrome b561
MHLIFARFEGFQDPAAPRRRGVYRVFNPRKGSATGAPALADKLAAATFAPAILFAAAFFPVSGYVGAIAMGRLLSMVVSMISQCFFVTLFSLPLYHTL